MENVMLDNILENNLNNDTLLIEEQNNLLQSNLGKALNTGLDIALRVVLPDFIEDQIINVKNTLMNQGLKEGFKNIVDSAINLGKSAIGIFSGKFENATQVENVVKKGGIIDSTSKLLNSAIDLAKKNKLINNSTATMLKNGKNVILDSINSNIENVLTNQIKSVEKLEKSIENWKNYYNQQDITKMNKEYKTINKELKNIIPLENIIKEAREIENIHNLIINNGNEFNLSETQLELAKKLV